MATRTLPFRIYDSLGALRARAATLGDAALIAGALGDRSKVTVGPGQGRTLWIEGVDGQAGESYDAAAAVMADRV